MRPAMKRGTTNRIERGEGTKFPWAESGLMMPRLESQSVAGGAGPAGWNTKLPLPRIMPLQDASKTACPWADGAETILTAAFFYRRERPDRAPGAYLALRRFSPMPAGQLLLCLPDLRLDSSIKQLKPDGRPIHLGLITDIEASFRKTTLLSQTSFGRSAYYWNCISLTTWQHQPQRCWTINVAKEQHTKTYGNRCATDVLVKHAFPMRALVRTTYIILH